MLPPPEKHSPQVAPRAKMNQQRSRRFRSSKEAEKLAATILARDGSLPDRDAFDSNCITPGTDFMLKLGLAMRKWIQYKQETDPLWKNGCDVVVSGPDVPGEGEHKASFACGGGGRLSHPMYRSRSLSRGRGALCT